MSPFCATNIINFFDIQEFGHNFQVRTWNFKYLTSLSDEFYDIEEQAFGNNIITPFEEWQAPR